MATNNQNNEVKSTFNLNETYDRMWFAKFNELCYEVFYKNSMGAQLLAHLENRYFRSPVAFPNKEPSWAYFNEGRNELIRSFTAGVQTHIAASDAKAKAQPIPRRAKVKPISNEG